MSSPHVIPSLMLTVPAVTASLCDVRAAVREHLLAAHVAESMIDQVVVAIDEACTNLVVHAVYEQPNATINVHVTISDTMMRVDIEDTAAPFHPDSVERPSMVEYFAKYRHHGLGISLMYTVMDGVQYIPKTGTVGTNRLILTKHLSR